MPELTCWQSLPAQAGGQTEDSHPGNLKDAQNYHMLPGKGPAGKCLGRRKKRSLVIDLGNVKGTQNKCIQLVSGRVIARLFSRRR